MNFDSGFFGETFLDVFYQMGLSREISGAPEEVSAQLESGIGTGLDSATDSEFRHLVSQLMYGKDKTDVLISQEREKFMADNVKRSAELLEPGKKILVLTGARHSQKANLFESARASFKPMAELLLANFPDDIYTTFFAFYRGEVSQDGTAVDGRIGKTTFERRLLPAETDVLAKLEERFSDQTLFVNLKEHSDWPEIDLSMVMKDYHADLSQYFDGIFIFPSVSVSDRFE